MRKKDRVKAAVVLPVVQKDSDASNNKKTQSLLGNIGRRIRRTHRDFHTHVCRRLCISPDNARRLCYMFYLIVCLILIFIVLW